MHFGSKLKALRTALNMKQVEFADYLGVTRDTVGEWEKSPLPPKKWERVEDDCQDKWPEKASLIPRYQDWPERTQEKSIQQCRAVYRKKKVASVTHILGSTDRELSLDELLPSRADRYEILPAKAERYALNRASEIAYGKTWLDIYDKETLRTVSESFLGGMLAIEDHERQLVLLQGLVAARRPFDLFWENWNDRRGHRTQPSRQMDSAIPLLTLLRVVNECCEFRGT